MNTQTSNYPATVRELGDMTETAPRLLEVLGSTPTPPAGYSPVYFVNEFAKEPVPELVCYSAPDIGRPGFKVQRSWNPDEGFLLWIDHNQDEAFRVPEIRDLITTLTGLLEAVTEAPEV